MFHQINFKQFFTTEAHDQNLHMSMQCNAIQYIAIALLTTPKKAILGLQIIMIIPKITRKGENIYKLQENT